MTDANSERRILAVYRAVALHWLNAWVMFALIIALSFAAAFAIDRWRSGHDPQNVYNALAVSSLPAPEAEALFPHFEKLRESIVYRPWIGYSELPMHAAHLNIDDGTPVPARRTLATTRPGGTPKTIWLFGGSTTLGVGVPDDQTIASHLQNILAERLPAHDVRVANCGHLGHFSSQELALMQWMLRAEKHADVAVFIDGLNDVKLGDYPDNTEQISSGEHGSDRWVIVTARFPPLRMLRSLLRRASKPAAEVPLDAHVNASLTRYLANVRSARATAAAAGMRSLFVWQPTPFESVRLQPDDPREQRIRAKWLRNPVIKPLNAAVRQRAGEEQIVCLADLFASDEFMTTYVDTCHYGDRASRKLAAAIADALLKDGALDAR